MQIFKLILFISTDSKVSHNNNNKVYLVRNLLFKKKYLKLDKKDNLIKYLIPFLNKQLILLFFVQQCFYEKSSFLFLYPLVDK